MTRPDSAGRACRLLAYGAAREPLIPPLMFSSLMSGCASMLPAPRQPPVMLTTTKATTYYSVHETTSKIFEEMVLRVPVHQGLHAGDVLAPVRDVLDAVHALGGLVGQRGRALVGRDSLLGEEVDADFFVDVYGPGVGREKMVTERLDNILHS